MYKKKLKIGIFWEQYEYGGVDSHIKYLLEGWKNNDDTFVIYHNNNNQGLDRLKKEINKKNIVFKEIKSLFNEKKNYINFFLIPIKFFLSILKYKKFLRNENLDVIISQNGGYPASYGVLAALVSAYKINVPVRILVIHHQATQPSFLMGIFRSFLDRLIPKIASSIICVSEATKQSLYDNTLLTLDDNTHVKVIYNCVPNFLITNQKEKIFEKKDKNLIGIIGRIEDYKGHKDLIYAFSRMPEEIKIKNRIIIIGKGKDNVVSDLKKFIKNLDIEDHVNFTGFLSNKIEDIIRNLDLVVMPTRSFEGFGYAIAESMSAGTPVLSSKIGAVEEYLSLKEGGLFESGNIDDLTNNLIDFNNNKDQWITRAEIAKKKINNNFDSVKISEQFREHILLKYLDRN